jgi:hypothetical protein
MQEGVSGGILMKTEQQIRDYLFDMHSWNETEKSGYRYKIIRETLKWVLDEGK